MMRFAPILWLMLLVSLPASAQTDLFPGITPLPLRTAPLFRPPSVITLTHREPIQMDAADYDVAA